MAIDVKRVADGDPLEFEVVVREGNGETRHHVTIARTLCDKLTAGKHTPEACLDGRVSASCSTASRRNRSCGSFTLELGK